MTRRTHEDSLETKQNILASAQRLFTRRGYERTSLSDIAKFAGVTRGAIYWHFENKEELLVCMIENLETEKLSIGILHEAINPNEIDPLSKLKMWMKTIIADDNAKFINSTLMSMIIAIMNGSSGNDGLREKLLNLCNLRHTQVCDALRNCIAKGQLPSNLAVRTASEHIGVFTVGFIHQSRFDLADTVAKNFNAFIDIEMESIKKITTDAFPN